MDPMKVGLKDYLVVGSLTGFVRMAWMHFAAWKQEDLTYWESYATWAVSSAFVILVYAIGMWT